jgi:UDPglucose--hexose-1-phosphate uridylyltransferase
MPELRRDPIVGRWVIIATERAKRPVEYKADHSLPRTGTICPFCPGNEDKTPPPVLEYPGGAGGAWSLRVVPNKFPVLKIEGALDREGEGLYDRMNGIGAHEVLVETPEHDKALADLEAADIARVIAGYRDRILDLKKDVRFRYVMVFKNQGAAAGATLAHTHSQLIALPVVPIAVRSEMQGARGYYDYKERCVFCDIVKQDLRDGRRVIYDNGGFVVIAPYAPKFPFETWILPKHHAAAFEDLSPAEVTDLADALKRSLRKLDVALENPPYNYIIHTAPFGEKDAPHYHWHVEIMPTLTRVAGFEWGSGFYINPTPPEDAAAFLRDLQA